MSDLNPFLAKGALCHIEASTCIEQAIEFIVREAGETWGLSFTAMQNGLKARWAAYIERLERLELKQHHGFIETWASRNSIGVHKPELLVLYEEGK